MTYTIAMVPTVAGRRYYIYSQGKLMQGLGFATKSAAAERIRLFEAMDKDREQLKTEIRSLREKRSA